jgi:ABC-2 type transport system permease protein
MAMSEGAVESAAPDRPAGRLRTLIARVRTAAWLGWQIESNWADPLTFVVYSVLRPLGTSLILAGMFWAVSRVAARPAAFVAFYVANAFHEYVVRILIGMGWVVVEEREEYETLKYVITSPMGMITYLWGRSAMKFALASASMVLMLGVGWTFLGVRWDPALVRWAPLMVSVALGLVATVFVGFLIAGWALVLPRIAISMNEGVAVALYLLCGVIFPIDLLPRGLQEIALGLPFTYWYEAIRRFLLGHGASARIGGLSDAGLVGALALTTLIWAVSALAGYRALEHHARRRGKLDQTTLF